MFLVTSSTEVKYSAVNLLFRAGVVAHHGGLHGGGHGRLHGRSILEALKPLGHLQYHLVRQLKYDSKHESMGGGNHHLGALGGKRQKNARS